MTAWLDDHLVPHVHEDELITGLLVRGASIAEQLLAGGIPLHDVCTMLMSAIDVCVERAPPDKRVALAAIMATSVRTSAYAKR